MGNVPGVFEFACTPADRIRSETRGRLQDRPLPSAGLLRNPDLTSTRTRGVERRLIGERFDLPGIRNTRFGVAVTWTRPHTDLQARTRPRASGDCSLLF